MMSFRVTVPPAELPLTIDEVRAHIRQDSEFEDAMLFAYVRSMVGFVESWLGRSLVEQTIELTLDCFPDVILVPRPRLRAVSAITYLDANGVQQTLDSSVYHVAVKSEPGTVRPAIGQAWPSTRAQPEAVTVTYTAGYGSRNDVPDEIRHGLLILVGHHYEHREPIITGTIVAEVPMSAKALLEQHRVGWF